jgi:hypothetical protein
MIIAMFIIFSGQSPRVQKRLKILERTYGKKTTKPIPAKSKKEKNIRVIKKTERQPGVIVSKSESNDISQRYTEWKKETDRLETAAKSGSKEASYELRRRREIGIHLNRVAKIQALHAYAKQSKNTALLGKSMLLMHDENLRFEKAMLALAD